MPHRLIGIFALFALVMLTKPATARQPADAVPGASDQWTIIHCGTLLAVPGEPPLQQQSILIKNERIDSVVAGLISPDSIRIKTGDSTVSLIDLSSHFVLPGLIDCHVHLTHETSPEARLRRVTDSEADTAINGVVYARRTLEAGFTTVRDLGSMGETCFALRDAINAGKISGPRIIASGKSVTPTGGHGDGSNGYREDLFEIPGPMQGVADGVDACRAAVRNQVRRGADCIKLTATGGVLSNIGAGLEQQFFEDELRAIVETSHLLGKKVAAHAHGLRGINAALRAGVNSIEHGTYLDDESISLFKEKGAFYVPTITAGKSVAEYAAFPNYYTAAVVKKATTVGPMIQDAFARAYKGGVKIAFGTDAGVFPHGQNAREFIYMVEAGMPPAEAIYSATITAAELLDLTSEVGTLEAGKAADVIAVQGDPLREIAELKSVRFVMKGGAVIKDAARK